MGTKTPFRCDDGSKIDAGDGVYLNVDCIILDGAPVWIGNTMPSVVLSASR